MTKVEESNIFSGVGAEFDYEAHGGFSKGEDRIVLDGPDQTSVEYQDWVMGLFEDSELREGRPLVHGLRRVAQLVLGPLVASRPTQIFPPTSGEELGRSTVVWEVVFEDGKLFSDVADCWEGNTDDAFVVFNTATAATRAESRALRKALGLKTAAAEEMTSKNTASVARSISAKNNVDTEGEFDGGDRMTDPQANFIDSKAKQLDVNVELFFKEVFDLSVKRKVDKRQASAAIEKLNEYQQDKDLIPKTILNYSSDWRQ